LFQPNNLKIKEKVLLTALNIFFRPGGNHEQFFEETALSEKLINSLF